MALRTGQICPPRLLVQTDDLSSPTGSARARNAAGSKKEAVDGEDSPRSVTSSALQSPFRDAQHSPAVGTPEGARSMPAGQGSPASSCADSPSLVKAAAHRAALPVARLSPTPQRSPQRSPQRTQLLAWVEPTRGRKRRAEQNSPNRLDLPTMVLREDHPINQGKKKRLCTGMPGKWYNRHDIVTPIVDGMTMMYYRMGWGCMPCIGPAPEADVSYGADGYGASRTFLSPALALASKATDGAAGQADGGGEGCSGSVAPCIQPNHAVQPCRETDEEMRMNSRLHEMGLVDLPPGSVEASHLVCKGCLSDARSGFLHMTKDKSHFVCRCGVVLSPVHIATDREKNCAREDDKTTHADRPYEPRTDRFDHPAQSCDELRKQREREACASRISRKAREKHGLGFVQEHTTREAARAERQRQEMEPRDQTKGQHIQIELDKLFGSLEPLNHAIKRYCRMEADRAWREAVRHSRVCCAKNRCQLHIKEKGPPAIADVSLTCALSRLLEGHVTLDGVTRAGILVVADKLGALQGVKGTSCALRAMRTIVATFMAHGGSDPVPSCPLVQHSDVEFATPVQEFPNELFLKESSNATEGSAEEPAPDKHSLASDGQSPKPTAVPGRMLAKPGTPFIRTESSASDLSEQERDILQLRDSITQVFRLMGASMRTSVRDAALGTILNQEFRASLADARAGGDKLIAGLTASALAYALLTAVSDQMGNSPSSRGAVRRGAVAPPRLLAGLGSTQEQLQSAVAALEPMLPDCASCSQTPSEDGDGLFD